MLNEILQKVDKALLATWREESPDTKLTP